MSSAGEREGRDRDGAAVSVRGLTVGYDSTPVLEDVELGAAWGEVVTVLGTSGCGKTTLLRAMTGLLPVWGGEVCVAGEDIGQADRQALRRMRPRVGVMFQTGALLGSLTLGENVALPLEKFTDLPRPLIRRIVGLKLDMVGLQGQENRVPSQVSGGMRRRAGLARALALDPEILFCDEPTVGLDPLTAVEIDKLLLELREVMKMTVVVVSHALGTIENLSGTCVMLGGQPTRVIATGTLEQLRHSDDERVRGFFQRRIDGDSESERESRE